ncbi:hypothetical protein ACHAWO_012977 [Cyclotella atomus]|uniref:Ankyrin repeat protein n=1 Tax=Cyclotella atomus TaxID=382360 RepID=A0ABD3PUJ8_9STRA
MSDLFEEIVTLLYYEADLSVVRSRVETNPLVVLEQSSFGSTLLHIAAIYCTSPEYYRMLLEFDPNHESLRMTNKKESYHSIRNARNGTSKQPSFCSKCIQKVSTS